MKTPRWFNRNRFFSFVRIATAGTFVCMAAAMAFVAVKSSSPALGERSDGKGAGKLGARSIRANTVASHLRPLVGRANSIDGVAQEIYDNTAYPSAFIADAERKRAAYAAKTLHALSDSAISAATTASWQSIGPNGVPVSSTVVTEFGNSAGSAATIFSGRATAIAVSPACNVSSCTGFIGAAGGGVWKTNNALASAPTWVPANNGIPSNAIGSIVFDPNDATRNTIYVGTGEPNTSFDSEAGVGLYKSTNGGSSWSLVSGSTASTAACASGVGMCPVATGRSIGAIAIDPVDASHIFIGTDVARHGSSSVSGGRFSPPGSAKIGLYESTNGGTSFSPVVILAQDVVKPSSATGGDAFRGGCSHIELYRPGIETQVYASFFDYGVFRRSATEDGNTAFHHIFLSGGGGTTAGSMLSRTEFSLAPNSPNLRVYVGDANANGLGTLYRVDNANVAATSLFNGTSNVGWKSLSSSTKGTPGFSSYNYCGGQCFYDMPVYSPPGHPGTVYIGGQMQYDEIATASGPSNGRALQRSTDAGVHFTDMTVDFSHDLSLHPDEHAIVATPLNPDIVFIANDGGIWRLNGAFTNASSQCASRGLSGADLTDCQMWLSAIPTSINSLNRGLGTLQFLSVSPNPANPLHDLLGGTQDNGTQVFSSGSWFMSIYGDGGQSGISFFHSNIRFANLVGFSPEVNFNGDSETGWDWTGDPLFGVEPQSASIPMIDDPKVDGTMFAGLDFVWRTMDNGGNQATLDAHCNLLTGDFPANVTCGDWVRLEPGSGKALGDGTFWGSDKAASGYVVATTRAPSDKGTLWVGTRRGRVFVTSNANVTASSVTFFRVDTSAQPTRFVSDIDVDPSNPNHAFVSYSGYNAYASAAGTARGHVFEVTYNPATHVATWSSDLAGGSPPAGLGDQPVTGIAVDWQTRNIYVSTDFGVFVRKSGTTAWQTAGGGLPPVATYGLTLNVSARVLYAATHGRGIWMLSL